MASTLETPNRPGQALEPEGRPTFDRCVQTKASATLLIDVAPGRVTGSFEAVGETLTIRLPHGAPAMSAEQSVALTFVVDGRWSAVLTRVVGCTSHPRGWMVELTMPFALQTEMRRYPRIRVGRGSNLRASLTVNEERYDPLVQDLSLGGTFVNFADDVYPVWNLGTLVRVRLVVGLATLTLIATVVRQAGEGYGLAFNQFSANAGPEREQLEQVLALLEGDGP